jgi:hypothetical protein
MGLTQNRARLTGLVAVLVLFGGLYLWGLASWSMYCKYTHLVLSDDGSIDISVNLATFNPQCEQYVYEIFRDGLNFIAILTIPVLVVVVIALFRAKSVAGLFLGTALFAMFTWSDIDGLIRHVDRLFLFAKPVSDLIFFVIGYWTGKGFDFVRKRVCP